MFRRRPLVVMAACGAILVAIVTMLVVRTVIQRGAIHRLEQRKPPAGPAGPPGPPGSLPPIIVQVPSTARPVTTTSTPGRFVPTTTTRPNSSSTTRPPGSTSTTRPTCTTKPDLLGGGCL